MSPPAGHCICTRNYDFSTAPLRPRLSKLLSRAQGAPLHTDSRHPGNRQGICLSSYTRLQEIIEVHRAATAPGPHVYVHAADPVPVGDLTQRQVVCRNGAHGASIHQRPHDRHRSHTAVARIRPAEDFVDQE